MTRAFTPWRCYKMWKNIEEYPICSGKKSRCIYAEVLSERLVEPYISICVRDPYGCTVGFRYAKPLRLAGYHVAGMGSAFLRCGKVELRIEPICVVGRDRFVKLPILEPYGGPTDIAVRVWGDGCVRIAFDNSSYCICP